MLNRRIVVAALAAFLFCPTINGAAHAAPFVIGDFITYSQDDWGTTSTTAGHLMSDHFDFVYPGGGIEIGLNGAAGFSAIFISAEAVSNYLPADGNPAPLDNDLQDPVSTSSGTFGGLVLALQFNVDFNDGGLLMGSSSTLFGDLILHDLTATPAYNSLSVRQVLVELNHALGGEPTSYTYDDLAILSEDLARAFESGTPSAFAQDHLQVAAQPVPEPATLTLLGVGIAALKIGRSRRNR
jgi:PEP-CTERM motif